MVFGEITCAVKIDYESIVRATLQKIGYDAAEVGMDYRTAKVVVAIEAQSPDIAQGVHENRTSQEEIGAGDQGHMFGYATDETEEKMPLSHVLAMKLGARLTFVRQTGLVKWMRPDGKTQVTVQYTKNKDGLLKIVRIHTVVISIQHENATPTEQIHKDLMEHVISVVLPSHLVDKDTIMHLNPSGRFVIGGPHGDAGLTGRKIIVDTYGGWGAHGGGAFSGKDPTKVDRSAAYAARWVAKSLVHAKLAKRVLVQVSYAIGIAAPLSVYVDSYGTGKVTDKELLRIVHLNFDLRPGCLIRDLNLLRPIYQKTACHGHFGRAEPEFTWEMPKVLKL